MSAVEKVEIESTGKLSSTLGEKARPFLGLKFKRNGKGQQYNFAATGTFCPVGATAPNTRRDLVNWPGGSVCPAPGNQNTRTIPGFGRTTMGPMYVPQAWMRNLTLIQRMIQIAGGGGAR